MTEDELKRILDQEIESAIGYVGGDLAADREKAMNYYLGEASGDLSAPSIEDRSDVVSTDVADVIEWIKPSVLKTFVSSDEAVRFDPTSEEDEEQAEQESDYVSHVFTKENNDFLVYYSWFTDALLQKVGVVKNYWDKSETVTTEEFSGLTDAELAEILSDPEVEPIEHTPREEVMGDGFGGVVPVIVHDLKIKRTKSKGQAKVVPVPPEEFLVNSDHNSINLQEARFAAHERHPTVSELVQEGYDFDELKDLPAYTDDWDSEDRNTVNDEDQSDDSVDPSQRKLHVFECYPLIDTDGDGIAERRKIVYVKGAKILENEEADCVPFSALTPIIMPHRFVGLSIYDRLKSIQKQKTIIWRQLLDNMVMQNNQRTYVNVDAGVNLDDLLTNRPMGVVRGKRPYMDAISPIAVPPTGQAGYQMLDYLDKVRTERGGVGPESMGQNINLSNDTAHGIERLMSAKEELVALITRVFGETGVKDMFLQLRALLAKHQDKEKVVKLRGKWVPVNPSEWRERTSMTIKVGLGAGDRMKQQMALKEVMQIQEKILMAGGLNGMVTGKHVYNAISDLTKAAGLNGADQYFTDPSTVKQPPKPKQPDPNQMIAQMQMQIEEGKRQNEQMKMQLDAQNKEADRALKKEQAYNDLAERLTELELKYGQNVPGAMV